MESYYVLLLCALAAPSAFANSAGAPKDACIDLVPQHGVKSQTSSPPYTIIVSQDSVKTGDAVKITIKGQESGTLIKGFLAQARVGNTPVGTFTPGPHSQTLDCNGSKDSITHQKLPGDGVHEVVFTWNPPNDLKGPVSITATVAQNGAVFWVGKLSSSVNIV